MGNPEKQLIPERLAFARSRYRPPVEGVGKHCVIHSGAVIGKGSQVGNHVVIHGRVVIGERCIIKDHAVIGASGFSFAHDENGVPIQIYHNGGVVIGNDVLVGSFNTVISGTVEPTVLCDFVKLDDFVHFGHNCKIGARSCVAARVAFGGSAVIGEDVWVGLGAIVNKKVVLGNGCLVGSGANVLENVPDRAIVVGNPAKVLRYV
jgi:UDP-3-O-[3-hydroxymyristoyl] glucosamine N-acyltransferase